MNKLYYILIAIAAILFFTNPSTKDFKSEIKTAYNEQSGQGQMILAFAGAIGKMQVCRRNFLLFSVYRTTYKSVLSSKDEPTYYFGILSNFRKLDEGLGFLTDGSYSTCEDVKKADLK